MLLSTLISFSGCYFPSDDNITALIRTMSLAEKIGQMANIAIDNFIDPKTDQVVADYATVAINHHYVGSLQNSYSGKAHSRQTWARIQRDLHEYAMRNPSKIPLIYGIDSIHGATYIANSTLFPQEIGIAATFNTTLARIGSEISAYETRSASISWVFAPVVDLGLDPRWSRIWEDFGEDPYLSGEMGAAMVAGFQGANGDEIDTTHVLACAKHYLGYGNPVTGKDRTPAIIPENYLREYHLPPFQRLVEADIATVMVNSALINGLPVHASKFLLTDLLKGELGFRGFVVSDWQDIENLYIRDHVAKDQKDAIRLGINAGLDMSIVPYNLNFTTMLLELVQQGAVPVSRINDAVGRILRVKARVGAWKTPYTQSQNYPKFGSAEHELAAYSAAAESITLLKNENMTLPIAAGSSILVVGPNGDSMRVLDGGWSYSWQGIEVPNFATKYRTIFGALRANFGDDRVDYVPGTRYTDTTGQQFWAEEEVDIQKAASMAAQPKYSHIVLVLGENSYTETPGDLQDLTLSELQLQLADAVIAAAGRKKVVLVLSEGRPRIVRQIVDKVHAVVMVYLPGNFGGDALADILSGKVNPSGKLPFTYPRWPQGLLTYWHKYSEEVDFNPKDPRASDWAPQWEFGFGLSYTLFQYQDLVLSSGGILREGETMNVSVTVMNTGTKAGKEVVMLFTSDLVASVTPDVKRLRKFQKIELQPGRAKRVEFQLRPEDLSFVNMANKRVTEPGKFKVRVGTLSAEFRFQL